MPTIISGDESANFAQPLPQSEGGTGTNTIPAFSAYAGSAQSLPTTTETKLLFNTEEFDTNSNYDTSNGRFTPTVAGYYRVNGGYSITTTQTGLYLYLFKNGVKYKTLSLLGSNNGSSTYGSCLVYCNGTTDYIELFAAQLAAAQNTVTGISSTYFQGELVRAA
jgi:hypothetical protein